MNETAWRALDLMRAYAARDRAGVVEHFARLEADQLEYAGGVLIAMYNVSGTDGVGLPRPLLV
jgi:hypothetical protein